MIALQRVSSNGWTGRPLSLISRHHALRVFVEHVTLVYKIVIFV